MNQTTLRAFWNGPPERLPGGFAVIQRKGDRTFIAVCETWTHFLGWELRLDIDGRGLQMSTVVRSAADMLDERLFPPAPETPPTSPERPATPDTPPD